MSFTKLFSCAAAAWMALAACHDDERTATGNTGASVQPGVLGDRAQQIDTDSNRPPAEGSRAAEPMGQPGPTNTIGQGPSGAIGPQETDITTNADSTGTVVKNKDLRKLQQQALLRDQGQQNERTTMR
jgi:hypothetical protein